MELKYYLHRKKDGVLPVLIIPYGIEIYVAVAFFLLLYRFNHTLWN